MVAKQRVWWLLRWASMLLSSASLLVASSSLALREGMGMGMAFQEIETEDLDLAGEGVRPPYWPLRDGGLGHDADLAVGRRFLPWLQRAAGTTLVAFRSVVCWRTAWLMV